MAVWYERMVAEFIGLTPGEDDAHRVFNHLINATHAEMNDLGCGGFSFLVEPYDARDTARRLEALQPALSQTLIKRWDHFASLYPTLVKRNPRLDLRDLLQEMSERRESISWPEKQEWAIERWVAEGAQGERTPYGIDADIRTRLLDLHPQLDGWLYNDHSQLMIVFAKTDEFRQVKVRLDAERQRRIHEERLRIEKAQQQRRTPMQAAPRRWRITSIEALHPDHKP